MRVVSLVDTLRSNALLSDNAWGCVMFCVYWEKARRQREEGTAVVSFKLGQTRV